MPQPGRTPATPEGPLVLPGTYTLRLTANGTTSIAHVTVRNDPRSRATPAALSAQHALQQHLTTGMRAAYRAQQQVTTLRAALTQAATGATGEAVTAIGTLRAAIDSAVGPESRETFRTRNGEFASQLMAQDHADHAPNAPMLAARSASSRRLTAAQAAWARVLSRDLPALNTTLTRLGLRAVLAP